MSKGSDLPLKRVEWLTTWLELWAAGPALVSCSLSASDGEMTGKDFPLDSGNHLFLSFMYSHRSLIRLRRLLKLHPSDQFNNFIATKTLKFKCFPGIVGKNLRLRMLSGWAQKQMRSTDGEVPAWVRTAVEPFLWDLERDPSVLGWTLYTT